MWHSHGHTALEVAWVEAGARALHDVRAVVGLELACFRLRAPTGSKWRLRDDSLRALALRCTAPEPAWSWLTTCPRGTGRCRTIGAPCGVCTPLGTPRASGRGFSLFGVRGAGFFWFFASHLARAHDGLRDCAARLGTVCSSVFVGRCAPPYATLSRFQRCARGKGATCGRKKGIKKWLCDGVRSQPAGCAARPCRVCGCALVGRCALPQATLSRFQRCARG